MNGFRVFGDVTHLLTILMLLAKILKSGSCAGISGKTQILLALVFTTRYLDLFFYFISYYNSILKCAFLFVTYSTLFLIYFKRRKSNEYQQDSFRIEILIAAAFLEACFTCYSFTTLEVLWAFSIYLESVALLPQLFLISKSGVTNDVMCYYVLGLGIYRGFYIFNWIYRYFDEGNYDVVSIMGGIAQTVLVLILGLAVVLPACRANRKNGTQEERNEPVQKAIHKAMEAWSIRLGAAGAKKDSELDIPLVHKSTKKANMVIHI